MDSKNFRDDFPQQAKARLYEMEMTQKELAKIIGIRPGYLYVILQGRRKGFKHREKIRNALGMPSVRTQAEKFMNNVNLAK